MSDDLLLKRLVNLLRENGIGEMDAQFLAYQILALLKQNA